MKPQFTVHDLTNVLLIVIAVEFGVLLLRPVDPTPTPPITTAGSGTVVTYKDGKLQLWRLRPDRSDPARRMKLCLEDQTPVP